MPCKKRSPGSWDVDITTSPGCGRKPVDRSGCRRVRRSVTNAGPPQNREVRVARRPLRHMAAIIAVLGVFGAGAAPAQANTYDATTKQRRHIKERVRSQVGSRYSYGGTSPGAFDCSGLTRWTFDDHGA